MLSRRQIWMNRAFGLCCLVVLCAWPAIGLGILFAFVVYIVAAATWYQGYLRPSLERGLGFTEGSVCRGPPREKAVAIQSVVEGGPFALAGFRSNHALPDWSHTGLFRYLHRNRGRVIELEVVDGDFEGPPFHARPRTKLSVAVPTIGEAPPTRADFLQGISPMIPLLVLIIGGIPSYLILRSALPGRALWMQILVVFLTFPVLGAFSLCLTKLIEPRPKEHRPRLGI